jgi:hypothetical protein
VAVVAAVAGIENHAVPGSGRSRPELYWYRQKFHTLSFLGFDRGCNWEGVQLQVYSGLPSALKRSLGRIAAAGYKQSLLAVALVVVLFVCNFLEIGHYADLGASQCAGDMGTGLGLELRLSLRPSKPRL